LILNYKHWLAGSCAAVLLATSWAPGSAVAAQTAGTAAVAAATDDAPVANAAGVASGHAVTTVAVGIGAPSAFAAAPDGTLYVADASGALLKLQEGTLEKLAGAQDDTGYVDGALAIATFGEPSGIAMDSKGSLYISDASNHVVRKLSGERVITVGGNGHEGYANGKQGDVRFNYPTGLAIDGADNVYVADTLNGVIRRITPDGTVETYAGTPRNKGGYRDGEAKQALFNEPTGLALDEEGGLYVADSGNGMIRYIADGEVTTIAGAVTTADFLTGYRKGGYRNGDAAEALFRRPSSIAYADGVLFVADSLNNRIRAIGTDGKVVTLAGTGAPGRQDGKGEAAGFNQPSALLYRDGELYIADALNGMIRSLKVHPSSLSPVRSPADLLAATPLKSDAQGIQVWLDGEKLEFQADKRPFYKDEEGTAYVPVRALLEAWEAELTWNETSRIITVTKGERSLSLDTNNNAWITLLDGSAYAAADELAQLTGFLLATDDEYDAIVFDSGQ
jgi:sugar lactone lactonase YvrE